MLLVEQIRANIVADEALLADDEAFLEGLQKPSANITFDGQDCLHDMIVSVERSIAQKKRLIADLYGYLRKEQSMTEPTLS